MGNEVFCLKAGCGTKASVEEVCCCAYNQECKLPGIVEARQTVSEE
ncbi:hypothetical protein [Pontibacter populi]|uniref:Uncharacterized protein n=1 Tax=Pontibacter populi TaxID=890055 RepID=A0ABV1RUQ4_9BACT